MNVDPVDIAVAYTVASSGKTYCANREAKRCADMGQKIMIAQPTKELISETVADFVKIKGELPFRAIHGGTSSNVVADLAHHMNATDSSGEVVYVTHAALLRMPYLPRRSEWHLIVDEVPETIRPLEFTVPVTHRLVTDHLEALPCDPIYARLVAKDPNALRRIARNDDQDEVWEMFRPLADAVTLPNWDVFVSESHFHSLTLGKGTDRLLLAYAILKPEALAGFASTTIMSACFEETMLYRLWHETVTFRPHRRIMNGLRYTEHPNGEALTILYAVGEDWSKALRKKSVEVEGKKKELLDLITEAVQAEFNGDAFVSMANKDVHDGLFGGTAARLPNSPFGLNKYQSYHNAVVLSALNPTPATFRFLESRGLNGDEVRTALYRQAVYQAGMRISLRNPDDTSPKRIIVMDRPTADWLAGMFPGCTVSRLRGLDAVPVILKGRPGRPRHHESRADRTRVYRQEQEKRRLAELDLINGTSMVVGRYPELE